MIFHQRKRLKRKKNNKVDADNSKINPILYKVNTTITDYLNAIFHRLDQDISVTAPQNPTTTPQQPTGGLCSRTYITFSDDEAFETAFPPRAKSSPQIPVQEICPVTHKAALYRDPVTDIPYANARAFRIIREAYRKYVAAHGFPSSSGGGAGADSSAMKAVRPKMVVKQSGVTT